LYTNFGQTARKRSLAGIEHLVQTMPLGGCGAFSLLTDVFPELIRDLHALCERGD